MEAILNEAWTADVTGRMHRFRISNVQLAEECGYTAAYLSTVLNGRKTFESEEAKLKTKDRILEALVKIESRVLESAGEPNADADSETDTY